MVKLLMRILYLCEFRDHGIPVERFDDITLDAEPYEFFDFLFRAFRGHHHDSAVPEQRTYLSDEFNAVHYRHFYVDEKVINRGRFRFERFERASAVREFADNVEFHRKKNLCENFPHHRRIFDDDRAVRLTVAFLPDIPFLTYVPFQRISAHDRRSFPAMILHARSGKIKTERKR
jgi:hypothetical protein